MRPLDPVGVSAAAKARATYHFEDGGWWCAVDADGEKWTGSADTLDNMKALAREGIFMVTGKYPRLVTGVILMNVPSSQPVSGDMGHGDFWLLDSLAVAGSPTDADPHPPTPTGANPYPLDHPFGDAWAAGWDARATSPADERLREALAGLLAADEAAAAGNLDLLEAAFGEARAALAEVSAPAVRHRKPITAEEWAEGQPQAATAFPVAPPATGCESCGDESVAVRPGECCAACRRAHERLEPAAPETAAPVFDQRRLVDAVAFVNWHAEGPCGCDGDPDDPCDSCRALALLASWDAAGVSAEAAPDEGGRS